MSTSQHQTLSANNGNVAAVIDAMASVVVNVTNSCTASAINSAYINIGKGTDAQGHKCNVGEVVIGDLTIEATGDTMANCQEFTHVDIGQVHTDLQKALDDTMAASKGMEKDLADLKANLVAAITVDTIKTCSTAAVNAFSLEICTAPKVVIDNVTIRQTAEAQTKLCLQGTVVTIGDAKAMPMTDYLNANASWYTANGEGTPSSLCPGDASATADFHKAIYGGAGSLVLLGLVLLITGVLMSYGKRQ